jgi:hypothetical protein
MAHRDHRARSETLILEQTRTAERLKDRLGK